MRVLPALISLLTPLVLVAASASSAQAYERQWQAGLSAGYTHFINGGGTLLAPSSLPGFGPSLSLTYGLTDAWNVIGHVDMSYHPGNVPVLAYGGGAGVAYVIDILRWVPWLGITADGYGVSVGGPCVSTNDASCTTGRFGLSLLGAVDYQFNRKFSLGLGGRYGAMFFGYQNKIDQTISVYLRAQYIWGY